MKTTMLTVRVQTRPHRRPDPHRYAKPLAHVALAALIGLGLLAFWLVPVALANAICAAAGW